MATVGTLQVQEPRPTVQQILPVRIAIATALASVTADAVVALWAAEPGAATSISSGINRKHGQPPDPEARRRPPGRRRYVADRRQDRSTTSRTRDPPGPHFHRVPIVPDRLEDGGPAARLVKRQVVCERQMIGLSSHLVSPCRHVKRATRVGGRACSRQWPPSHSTVEVDHTFVRSAGIIECAWRP